MTAKDYWKERFGEYPQTDSEKLAVSMMQEYHRSEMVIKPASYEHHVQQCLVCGGSGKLYDTNSTSANICCWKCNGTGNVWV